MVLETIKPREFEVMKPWPFRPSVSKSVAICAGSPMLPAEAKSCAGKVASCNGAPKKQSAPVLCTLCGMETLVRPDKEKASLPSDCRPEGKLTLVNLPQA